jgi:hypothetical protein
MNKSTINAEVRTAAMAVWMPGLVLVGLALAVALTSDVTLRTLMQDATTVLNGPFYVGSLSLAGIIGWSLAAGVSLFTALAAPRALRGQLRSFLLAAGALSAVFLVDDAFLVHDEIVPLYLGISGELIGVAYIIVTAGILYIFRRVIATTNYVLLGAALLLLGMSAAVDIASTSLTAVVPTNVIALGEDGTKLIGIWTWCAYLVSVSRQALDPVRGGTTSDPA